MAKDKDLKGSKPAVDTQTTQTVPQGIMYITQVKGKRGGHANPDSYTRISRQGDTVYLFLQRAIWAILGNPKAVAVGYADGCLRIESHKADAKDANGNPIPSLARQDNASKPYFALALFTMPLTDTVASKAIMDNPALGQIAKRFYTLDGDAVRKVGNTRITSDTGVSVVDGVAVVDLAKLS